jgi:hypothetical protein
VQAISPDGPAILRRYRGEGRPERDWPTTGTPTGNNDHTMPSMEMDGSMNAINQEDPR